MPYHGKDHNDYVNGAGFCCEGKDKKLQAYGGGIGKGNEEYEKMQYYYHADHLGSSSYITNLDAQIVQHVEYVPFGEVFIEERNQSWNTPYLFNGKELDEETGLYYYGARYYNPRESVFLSVDPMHEMTGTPYQYTYQNPIKYTDPTGMSPEGEDPPKRSWFGRNISQPVGDFFKRVFGSNTSKGAIEAEQPIAEGWSYEDVLDGAWQAFRSLGIRDGGSASADDYGVDTKASMEQAINVVKEGSSQERAQLAGSIGMGVILSGKPTLKNTLPVSTSGKLLGTIDNGVLSMKGGVQASGTFDFVMMPNGQILLGRKHTFLFRSF